MTHLTPSLASLFCTATPSTSALPTLAVVHNPVYPWRPTTRFTPFIASTPCLFSLRYAAIVDTLIFLSVWYSTSIVIKTSNSFPVNRHSASAAPGLPRTSTLLIVLPIGFNIVVNTERRKLTDVDAKSSCTTSGSLAQMPFSFDAANEQCLSTSIPCASTSLSACYYIPIAIKRSSYDLANGRCLLKASFNLNFSPVLDTNRNKTPGSSPTCRHSSYDTRNTWQHCAKHLQGASLHSAYQTLGLSTTNHESDKKLTEILNVRYRPGQQRTTHIDSSVSRLKLAVSMGVQQQPLI
ncbi:hypothetical protein JR316_0010093 [Psilocybe cubensis]|uniref:Uncharacterized protein n=1 Tax=Psilocybe cubensis TaxID=181762 RepID=A0ACB8GQC7_PSICU|nr:hypothetical protein JR316_0010093 [Psilocybe cubensis]KAH9477861.1 hypothetical protein JR316_0010093 [Psilocybe cubensis]